MQAETKAPEIKVADWAPKVPPIFTRFLDPDNWRFNLSRPHVIGDYLYATNARVAVRMPTPEGWDIPNPEKAYQKTHAVFEPKGGVWLSVEIPEVAEPCDRCGGTGKQGRIRCECPQCGSDIDKPEGDCDGCEGSRVKDSGERVEVVPGYWIARGFAAILRECGVGMLLIPESLDHMIPASFVLGEVEGRLMAMTPPEPGVGP